jgi:4-methoxybenzoate monooxygenase (O-demethylating)
MKSSIPSLDLDTFSNEYLCYPERYKDVLLEAGPVFWLEKYGAYGVARHNEVTAVMTNANNFLSGKGIGLSNLSKPGAWREPSPIAEADPPQHTHIRKGMNKIVHPKVLKPLRTQFEEGANKLLDQALLATEIDGHIELAEAYIQTVFPPAVGIEPNRKNLLIVGHHSANAAGPQNDLFRESQKEMESVMAWYQHHQTPAAMIPGGLGDMIFEAEDEGQIPRGTAPTMVRTVLRGGLDNTISGFSSTLLHLARNPDQWRMVKEDRSLVYPAFEEAIRLESPSSSIFRTTEGDARIGDVVLEPDTKIQVFLSAANRDPRRWGATADKYDIKRDTSGHMAFGGGNHFCLGRNVAKLEWECFFNAFLDRVAEISLAAEPVYQPVNMLHTLKSLPLKLKLH